MKSAGNSGYKVVVTRSARSQLTQILCYLQQELGSEQAVQSVKTDMKDTKLRLSRIAGSLKLCEDSRLRFKSYMKIK